jgi:PAS domain S-box-containing protein
MLEFQKMDITDRKNNQEQSAESERRLAVLMANLPGMAYRCRNDEFWTMTFVSEGCRELTGFPSDHLLENRRIRYAELIHPDDRPMVWERVQQSLKDHSPFNLTYRIHTAGGHEKWVMEKGQGVLSRDGEVAAIEGFITDITDRRRTEEALRQSEAKFRLAFKTSPDAINLNRLTDGMYIDINEGFTQLTGYTREDAIGKTSLDLNIWADPRDRQRLLEGLRGEGYVENLEARFRRKNGEVGTGLMSARVLRLEQEDLILSVTRDITERKQVEDALRESENRYHQLFDASTDAILVRRGEIIARANPTALRLLRADHPSDLVGKRYVDFVHPDDRQESKERVRKSMRGDWMAPLREHRLVTLDGQVIHVESTGVPISYQGQIDHFGMFRDITERKQAEENLKETEKKYRELAESLPQVIFEVDSQGHLTYLNRIGFEIFSYTPEDFAGGINVLDAFIPEDRERIAHDIMLVIQGQRLGRREYTAVKKDGTRFPVGVHANRVLQGHTAVGVRGILIDLTSIRRTDEERKKLESQLQQAQKMEAIGALAGGIAHDFNNILSAIIGYIELAILNDDPQSCVADLHEALRAANRAKELVKQILAFSRQTDGERMPVKVGMVVKEAAKFLRATIPATIEMRVSVDEKAGAVLANAVELHQIILNLCTNAVHAIGDHGGVLEVNVSNAYIESGSKHRSSELGPGAYVVVSVKDTGHGIPPDLIHRIFDPYFTTKAKGVGTGLGLAVVHGIVKKSGGAIKVESRTGQGALFQIYLPRSDTAAIPPMEPPIAVVGGSERILFVDDEKMLIDIGEKMLERLGYRVVSRTSPLEALELFKAKPDHFDLVITDQTMPGMTGDLLARGLMQIRPNIPIILCTGYSQSIDPERAQQKGIKAFVMKPILINEIAAAIRRVLEDR